MMGNDVFLDVACRQLNCYGEEICGDDFRWDKIALGRRSIIVLSDGMGHGVKANILSTLTSTMLLNFIARHEDITRVADMILRMLPVCNVRKISYATFTIADVDNTTGEVTLVQHDNPPAILMRSSGPETLSWDTTRITRSTGQPLTLRSCRFRARSGDRLVMVSDGVTQSGQRTELYKFGWGGEALQQCVAYLCMANASITPADLALQVISKADMNDGHRPSDDMSCAVLHFRTPRRLMVISCPPSLSEENDRMADVVKQFDGEKIVCGYPVARILSERLALPMERDESATDPLVKPLYRISSFELVTEGMVVPNRVLDLLEHTANEPTGKGVAERFYRRLMRSDEIHFTIGLRHNVDAEPAAPDEFELRRNILRRIGSLLETRFGKKVTFDYF